MSISQKLRKRVNFQGEFEKLLVDVSTSYKIGTFLSFEPVEEGLEDLNIKLVTTKGLYFVKIFNAERENAECLRLINIIKTATDAGVVHPQFLRRDEGYIFRERYDDFNIRLAVFEYVDGKTFYELKRPPTTQEIKEIVGIASKINSIDYRPALLENNSLLINFPIEYRKIRKHLSDREKIILEKLIDDFKKQNLKHLPHSLVHANLTSENLIKTKERIYVVDFSSANYYPRILELAILMSEFLFDPKNSKSFDKNYKLLHSYYQKSIKLSKEELDILPLLVKTAHAMQIIRAARRMAKGDKSEKNTRLLNIGKKGLEQTLKAFK